MKILPRPATAPNFCSIFRCDLNDLGLIPYNIASRGRRRSRDLPQADMAELADALDSGSSDRKVV